MSGKKQHENFLRPFSVLVLTIQKRVNSRIGHSIEASHQERISEHYGILAEHFMKGEDYEKGSEYSKLAAHKSVELGSFPEAIDYAHKRVHCIENLPQTEINQRRIVRARITLSNYCMFLAYHVEAKDAVAPITDLVKKLDDKRSLQGIYNVLGSYYVAVEENMEKGFQYLEEALTLGREVNEYRLSWVTYWWLANFSSMNCEFKKGLDYYKENLKLAVNRNDVAAVINNNATKILNSFFGKEKLMKPAR